ncbi:uncharacterized protein [Mytilus edulis]|uniref:uncharacterized protein n=1 Tax=Mytilus edulis TaxID=6550 RepID=UPI0039F0B593
MQRMMIFTQILICAIVNKVLSFECDISQEVCETSLNIEHQLTMMHPTEKAVYPQNGKLYRYDVTNTKDAAEITIDDVITADGWETARLVVVANGTMPGPPIIVYEGQTVIVHVTNHLKSEDVTIHWHGLPQEGSPYMDGVPFLSQCPISTGQTFIYKFIASHKGTYWYHSHVGSQRSKGLFGAFIIRERKPVEIEEHILTIQEWNHDWDSDMEDARMVFGGYDNREKFQVSRSLDGQYFSLLKAHSGLINGKGRFWDSHNNTHNEAPLEIFTVKQGNKYRFRIIGVGALYPWTISIDGHKITVVASDGFDVEPQIADSVIINAGERYDVIIDADQPVGNYWIRAKTLESNRNTSVEAILHYQGALDSEPLSTPRTCSDTDKCLVVNCFFTYYPQNEFTICLPVDKLKHKSDNDQAPKVIQGKFTEYFLNFAFPGKSFTPGSVNGRRFISPTKIALANPKDMDYPCDNTECDEQKICTCTYSLNLKHGDTVQMVFLNMGSGKGWAHPIHMHGHTFYVLKMGYAQYDNRTGEMIGENKDIDCRGGVAKNESFCNDATWSNSSWVNGNIPDLELKKPVRKDTIIVPSGGYVVTRIVADNPGVWFMHCHIELHANDGMAIIINESHANHPSPPQNFPRCHSFQEYDSTITQRPEDDDLFEINDLYTERNFWIMFGVLCAVIVLQFIIILCKFCCERSKDKPEKSYDFNGHFNSGFNSKT